MINKNIFIKKEDNKKQHENDNNKGGKRCVHNIAERGATSLPIEHRDLVDVLLDRPTTTGRNEADVSCNPVLLQLDKTDLDSFHTSLIESKQKPNINLLDTPSIRKRDTEWIHIFNKYVSQVVDSCVFMYKGHHYSSSKSTEPPGEKQFLISADAKCSFSNCTCLRPERKHFRTTQAESDLYLKRLN